VNSFPDDNSTALEECNQLNWQEQLLNWSPKPNPPVGIREICLQESDVLLSNFTEVVPELPTSVLGFDGITVEINSIDRILALDIAGSLASTVVALGFAENLVGRDTATTEAKLQKLPVMASVDHVLNVEEILKAKPDLVITDGSLGPSRAIEQIRNLGIPVLLVDAARGISQNRTRITLVAQALGISERGDELASSIDQALLTINTEVQKAIESNKLVKPTVAFLYLRGQANIFYLLGEESGASGLIESAGGIDIAKAQGITDSVPLTSEALLAIQPDVILVMKSGFDSVKGLDGLTKKLPQLKQVKAIKEGNVVVLPDKYILKFSTYSPAAVMYLASALFGNQV